MRTELSISPWADLNRMWTLMDRLSIPGESESGRGGFPIDVYEQDGNLLVRATMPGVKPEDLKVSIDEGVLTVSGETRDNLERKEGGRVYHRESTYGKFVRSIRLPAEVNESEVDAQLDNGVLTVSMPLKKQQQQAPKQIQVRSKDQATSAIGSGERASGEGSRTGNAGGAYADRPDGKSERGRKQEATDRPAQTNSTRY